jgi:hypothetical protein
VLCLILGVLGAKEISSAMLALDRFIPLTGRCVSGEDGEVVR